MNKQYLENYTLNKIMTLDHYLRISKESRNAQFNSILKKITINRIGSI